MVDQFQRRPNARDREALERALAAEKRQRNEEILSSTVGLAVLLAASLLLTFVARIDDIWFPQRPAVWVQLAESGAFFALVATIGILFGLPSMGSRRMTQYFDRQVLRMTGGEIAKLRAALNGEVHVLRCDATDVAAVGDDDDEIEWYAFQVTPDRMLFLDADVSDAVAEEDRFPNSAFEIISTTPDPLDRVAVHCLGKPLRVRRMLPVSTLEEAEEGERPGRLADLAAATV